MARLKKQSGVTLITCTGQRAEAFDLCQQYMAAQTLKYDQWIVVHDGIPEESLEEMREAYPHLELYRGPRDWREGLNTHRFNMEEALSHVKGDCVAIIEDDDYYAPNYLENMVRALETADLVGLSNNKYYNLNIPGFREMGNFRHSSLCSTALKASILPMLQAAVDSGELYFDVHLWQAAIQNKVHFTLIANSTLCIGIKGMPGRPGVGVGHRNTGYSIDTNLAKLKEWLGNDAAELYMPYIKKVITAPVKQVATPKPAAKAVPQPQARVQQKPLAKLPQQAPTQNKNVDRAQVQQRPMGTVMPPLGTIPPEPQRPPQATTVSYPTGERMQGDVYKP